MRKTTNSSYWLSLLVLVLHLSLLGPRDVCCGETSDSVSNSSEDGKEDNSQHTSPEQLAKFKESLEQTDGLFPLLRNKETGELYLSVKQDQLGTEFIYFTYNENGVPQLGHFRGRFRQARIFTIQRDYQRLRFVFEPTQCFFDPVSPLHRSRQANVSPGVLAVEPISAWDDERTEFLVSADNIFLSEAFQQIKSAVDPAEKGPRRFGLGELNREKSRFVDVRNYPQNTDLVCEYVYDDPAPQKPAEPRQGVTDSRYVSIQMQHSLIAVTDNDYETRRDDPRIGFFTQQVDDLTSTSATPYRDVIHRWRLKKINPDADLSPPKQPIVWWLENSTPLEFRETIRNAVLAWNEAFEKAGFERAVEVRVQPDESPWEAGDLRYNVLRWTSSPKPPFGGFGPSFVNPRTGEILGADIMLEWTFITRNLRYRDLFPAPPTSSNVSSGPANVCEAGTFLQSSNLFGAIVLGNRNSSRVDVDEIIQQSLYYLILHEIGHTLGLSHNFRSSQLHTPEQLFDAQRVGEMGLLASVMDYPSLNLAPQDQTQTLYYTTRPGPYDQWAIEYGYSEALDDAVKEEQRLSEILARSTQPELAFGNDADDMRLAGRGVDPRIMTYDLSNDVIAWAASRLELINQTRQTLLSKYDQQGISYEEFVNQFLTLNSQASWALKSVSRYVAGVYVDRSLVGQPGAGPPLDPVDGDDQRQAMALLAEHAFSPDAFKVDPDMLARLQRQRRGFDHSGKREDFGYHAHVVGLQGQLLDHLLHPVVMARITDTALYGNEYPLVEMLAELTKAIFPHNTADVDNTLQQNLQADYVHRLIKTTQTQVEMASDGFAPPNGQQLPTSYDYIAQSIAYEQLRQIRASLGNTFDKTAMAHRNHLGLKIDRALAVPTAK